MSRKSDFPGRPRKCDNIPGSKACEKMRRNGSFTCRDCRAVKV